MMTSVHAYTSRTRSLMALAILLAFAVSAFAQAAPSKAVLSQIAAIQQVKQNFTTGQKKMDSHLAFAVAGQRDPVAVSSFRSAMTPLSTDKTGKVVVDITGNVTDALVQQIKQVGGNVLGQYPRFNSIRAAIPLATMETVASHRDVSHISSMIWAHTNVGSVTSQAYVSHRAKQVVEQQGISGSGVSVGVLSDSCTATRLAALQGTNDLPPTAYALAGQNGSGSDEGCAMMEIVYDMAPGSNQIFATAFNGQASFASNIIALQQAGAKVIVDDVTYFAEPVFQDGTIAQAVNQVTANGAIYFSSAANSGSKLKGTSGTWEGDFKDGGPVSGVIGTAEGGTGRFHDFGTNQVYDSFTATPSGLVFLQWSDPWGNACDDYDLFVTNSTGTTIKAYSASAQTCTGSDPIEGLQYSGAVNDRVYIVLYSGSARALHLDTERSRIAINTNGATFGHNAGLNTVSMAATAWSSAKKGVIPFTGFANPVETFSSDGPRKIFYDANGNAITPGNYLFGTNGGTTLKKPDITAADGVFTATPGFLPFFGTSAAAPHAAGIAALVFQARPGYTPAQVKTAMTATALDTEAVGYDVNSGYGIAMANGAVSYALSH